MVSEELSPVERVATLLEGIEAGLIGPRDVGSIAQEMVELVRGLATEPKGWTSDLARILEDDAEPPAGSAAGSASPAAGGAAGSAASGDAF